MGGDAFPHQQAPGFAALERPKLGEQAMALQASGQHDKAVELVRLHLRIRPKDAMAVGLMGVLLRGIGALAESEQWLRRAIALDPGNAAYHYHLGVTLMLARRPRDAIGHWERATSLHPAFSPAWIALSGGYAEANESDRAIEAARMALGLAPGEPGTRANLGLALGRAGRVEEACDAYRMAMEQMPSDPRLHSDYLLWSNYLARPAAEVLEAHRAFGRACRPHRPAASTDPTPDRTIRLGILSGDLHDHPVGFFAEALVADRPGAVEAIAFPTIACADGDPTGARIRGLFDRVVDVSSFDDATLDAAIRAERIDVLVELSGHTAGNRLTALASKPAPVVVTAIGYPNTTGLPAVDWRIVDSITDPPGAADLCTERPLRLDPCFLCYRPPDLEVEPAMPGDGPITFGSFNNVAKVSRESAELWARVLGSVPGSRLLLKTQTLADPAARRELLGRLGAAGIAGERIEMIASSPSRAEHLALYGRVHVALDSIPYNGTTTTCEALWMGVPVVALRGDRHASRVSASLLAAAGRPEWVADDAEGFVRLASSLAADVAQLAAIRASLRDRLRASTLLDSRGYSRRFHSAIRDCWRAWCAAQAGPGPRAGR